jgi:hypothetical protein
VLAHGLMTSTKANYFDEILIQWKSILTPNAASMDGPWLE